jgi:hypothetical protein
MTGRGFFYASRFVLMPMRPYPAAASTRSMNACVLPR